ncbi:MAG: glycoside hydrolase family 3 N-terminal domain-containing protein [bacterium]
MDSNTNKFKYPKAFNLNKDDEKWIEDVIGDMTLEEKCAQLIFPDANSNMFVRDTNGRSKLEYLVKDLKVGGVVFFEGDIYNQAAFTNHLQLLADIPLLIASDFERGLGMRLEDAVEYPYNMAIAATRDTKLAYLMGKYTGREGRAIGVHQNYAPVVDINHDYRNPIVNIRAFSDNTQLISEFADAFIKGMRDGNMLTCAKHFPGHGATSLDSHKQMPIINLTKKEFENADLIPFENAIKDGVSGIMVGHLEVPAYEREEKIPASVSNSIIQNLLIKKLGFDGLVISDAMNMHAITKNFDVKEATIKCIQAGTDILIFPEDPVEAVLSLIEAVKNNKIDIKRIETSVRKILAAKKMLKLDDDRFVNSAKIESIVSSIETRRLAAKIAEKSITLVKDVNGLVPVNLTKFNKIACITLRDTKAKLTENNKMTFETIVEKEHKKVKFGRLSRKSSDKDYEEMVKLAKNSDLILLPTYVNVRSFQGTIDIDSRHLDFIKKLTELKKPLVVMSFGNPYILNKFSDVPTYLTAYGGVYYSQKAMYDAVMGNTEISGQLPISIPETEYVFGNGIKRYPLQLKTPENGADTAYNFTEIDSLMQWGVKDSVFPGAVLVVGHRGRIIYEKAFGRFTYDKKSTKVNTSSMFDIASVSKVVSTTSAAMILVDLGKLNLDEKVSYYIPDFGNNGKENITVRNLLLHNSGLPEFVPFYKRYKIADEVFKELYQLPLKFLPGSKYLYSDLGMITLQKVIEKISGTSLDKFVQKNVFDVLEMKNTMYNPPAKLKNQCVPTEMDDYWRNKLIQGTVHDENAALLNGVAGHAGIFSTGHDLAVFLQTMLNKGKYSNKTVFNPSIVSSWTTQQLVSSSRGLGWDTKSEKGSSCGNKFSKNSFGHTGFTGTSVWVDKDKELFVVLLTNRVYPTRNNTKHIRFRPLIHSAIVDAIE